MRKEPSPYIITAKGNVKAAIEGYVQTEQFADGLAPLVKWSRREGCSARPVTATCDEIADVVCISVLCSHTG